MIASPNFIVLEVYIFLLIEPKTSHPTIGGFFWGRCLALGVFKGHVQCFFAIPAVQTVFVGRS